MARLVNYATAGANGATMAVGPRVGQTWLVRQVSVSAQGACTCTLDVDGNFVCSSASGQQDSADGDPEIELVDFNRLNITWPNLAPGLTATALVVYDMLQRS